MIKKIKSCFQHYANPLHVYCRLIDLGIKKEISRKICTGYELVYNLI